MFQNLSRIWEDLGCLDFPDISKQALSKARQFINPALFKELYYLSVDLFYKQLPSRKLWNGYHLFAIDGSKIEFPNSKSNFKFFGEMIGYPDPSRRFTMGLGSIVYDVLDDYIVHASFLGYPKVGYGYRRIHALLKRENIIISEKVIRRIMKEEQLVVKIKRTRKYNSYQGEMSPAVDNLINRNFSASKPNEKWLTDITEFAIPAGKVYLSPIVDCFDGLLVNWNISTSPDALLVNSMLDDAAKLLSVGEKPIIHSDRGVHYRWPGWIDRMEKNGFIRSMSKKGCSPDNSACEGVFGRIKNEMFYNADWSGVNISEFIGILNDYLYWYNEKRIKKSLGYLSPIEYRHKLGLVT